MMTHQGLVPVGRFRLSMEGMEACEVMRGDLWLQVLSPMTVVMVSTGVVIVLVIVSFS